MIHQVVLMIPLGFIESCEWGYLRRDLAFENFRFVELLDVSLGNLLLFVIGEEDGRTILRANIGPCRFNSVGS
jgi:hypothetical protein